MVDCSGSVPGTWRRRHAGTGAGQHVLVDAPFVDEFAFEGGASADGISIVPHRRGVPLGGVRRVGRMS